MYSKYYKTEKFVSSFDSTANLSDYASVLKILSVLDSPFIEEGSGAG